MSTELESFQAVDERVVDRRCPHCRSFLRHDAGRPSVAPFEAVAECVNLVCPMLPIGGCYWEPWPEGWTEENKAAFRAAEAGGEGA